MSPKARREWIDATQFHELSDREVLDEVVKRSKAEGASGVVILDLDSTLYEVVPRTFNILREWGETADAKKYPEAASKLREMSLDQVGYSLDDTFESIGLDLSKPQTAVALRDAKIYWKKRFFSNDYLVHDHPYDGAPQFVQDVFASGVHVAYLTGRDEPGMGRATREKLKADGFPIDSDRIHFYLKPQREGDDHDFKVGAALKIQGHGRVVASFENEPRNLIGLHRLFPEAMHVFVETHCSDHEADPGHGLYRIRSFER